MLSRATIRRIAQGVLGALLFSQAALALAACDGQRADITQALTQKAGEPSCHEEPTQNANLCLAHCLSADQSADTPQVAVPEWNQAILLVIVEVENAASRNAILYYARPRPAAPPPRILFQSFLI